MPASLSAIDQSEAAAKYNRLPFAFRHFLAQLELFSNEYLHRLCSTFSDYPSEYFVVRSAAAPDAEFYATPPADVRPVEAFERLATDPYKILLKRLELRDQGFRALLETLHAEMDAHLRPIGGCGRLGRLESSIFISPPGTITPFHFDPEVNFFFQVRGEKTYHLFPPSSLEEHEVEPLYKRDTVDIGQVDLARRRRTAEHVFALAPGIGIHQPQDSPHWVETGNAVSVSYTFVYETLAARRRGRVRAFNYYLRSAGLHPQSPGVSPLRDSIKAATMTAAIPVRRGIGRALRRWHAPL